MTAPKKKLIEVALPLEAINRGCEEDKNRKTGHIRNIHKWFAPMPLPAWRAMLFAALVDDPSEHLPEAEAARERKRLFALIEGLSRFESYKELALLAAARREMAKFVDGAPPVVLDPFCGGGSTILEAQRLGLEAVGTDLNPVPVLITTVLCRVAPLFGDQPPVSPARREERIGGWSALDGVVADVRYYGKLVRDRALKKLIKYYPVERGAVPFAFRWAWAVASPDPAARGQYTPLVSDWSLSRHKNSRAWVKASPARDGIRYSICEDGQPPKGNTGRTGARCLFTGTPIPLEYIRAEGRAGRLRLVMLAVAAKDGENTVYLAPSKLQADSAESVPEMDNPGIDMPDAALGFRVQQYGISNFKDLFTSRQAYALDVFANEVRQVHREILSDATHSGLTADDVPLESGGIGTRAYADAVAAVLGLCVGRMAQSNNVLVRWFIDPRNGSGKATPAFDRHAVPMVWDFVETNPFGGSVGDWTGPVMETALKAFDLCASKGRPAKVAQIDARNADALVPPHALVATDPPYYANIGYADLSDFFYLWHREALRSVFPNLYSTVATPKANELIATPYRHDGDGAKANTYFRSGFGDVFGRLVHRSDPRFPMLIVYAIKQAEESEDGVRSTGWEVFLGGLLDAGLSVVATWPVRTTTDTRMIGIGNNALASAIFVVGRRRPDDAPRTTRSELVREIRAELPRAVARLRAASIPPVDLAQASIGPGMAIFSRYSRVLEADGSDVSVGAALEIINQCLDESLAEQEAEFDSDTRWALAWFDQMGFAEGKFGEADLLSKAKNTSVLGLEQAGVVIQKGGRVRLLKPSELPEAWDPASDSRLTVWEMTHQFIRALEDGESRAAALAAKLGSRADTARDLAYRLFAICERRRRPSEAATYNGLVQSWPEIIRLAREAGSATRGRQSTLFEQDEE
jgi:putative DNA methylase